MKVISGGQTGADQAALQAAIDSGLSHGGWCPPDGQCEKGKIPARFQLKSTEKERSEEAIEIPRSMRTILNVHDADATLVALPTDFMDIGTKLTIDTAQELNKPILIINPSEEDASNQVVLWLNKIQPEVLNVAGPAESSVPGIGKVVYKMLLKVFSS